MTFTFVLIMVIGGVLWGLLLCLYFLEHCRHRTIPAMDGAGTVLSAEDQKKVQDVIDACPELAMQEDQEYICAICLGGTQSSMSSMGNDCVKQLQCGHGFHRCCLVGWCSRGRGVKEQRILCPLCRQKHPTASRRPSTHEPSESLETVPV
ncbi:unnamed protein product [Durusdinium trenchii]|uniref:RING-type domain-containing protein n=1 Tax=Durusdinium trenchii TaxID=1381693 RepID=A0ABP0SNK9_9DINO